MVRLVNGGGPIDFFRDLIMGNKTARLFMGIRTVSISLISLDLYDQYAI